MLLDSLPLGSGTVLVLSAGQQELRMRGWNESQPVAPFLACPAPNALGNLAFGIQAWHCPGTAPLSYSGSLMTDIRGQVCQARRSHL